MKITRTLAVLAGLAIAAAVPAATATAMPGPAHHPSSHRSLKVHEIRKATAEFHNIAAAEAAGYVPFSDINGVSCIDEPGMGGMGVHYVNPTLIADPAIHPRQPEALVYAPERDGTLRLAALEYLVDKSAWDSTHTNGPHLFRGHPFDVTLAPNRYGLNTFYSQHVWAWKANPAGLLAMWNPTVHCAWA